MKNNNKDKIKIILDCDPGHDDAIAIMVAGLSDKFDLLGITTVAGNQTQEKVSKNALKICDYLGIDKPVYAGMTKPILREQITAPLFHGETGLDGIKLPETEKKLEKEHAVNYIINTIMNSNEDIILVPVGPLTNIAMAMLLEPKIKEKIEKIVLMGGSSHGGNRTEYAEFNIYADPEAAQIVLNSDIPIYMMGLEVTNKTSSSEEIVEKIKKIGTKASDVLYQGLHFPKLYDKNGNFKYHTLHDVVTLAYLIDNSVVKLEKIACEIELKNDKKYGKTICSNFLTDEYENKFTQDDIENSNIWIATEIDVNKFWDILFNVIK